MLRMDIYINGELLELQKPVVLTPYQLYLLLLSWCSLLSFFFDFCLF